jgi:hypothetical protein
MVLSKSSADDGREGLHRHFGLLFQNIVQHVHVAVQVLGTVAEEF